MATTDRGTLGKGSDDAARGPWWKRAAKVFGPGLITGASDDDPSGIATYAQAGATYGFGMVWAAPVVLPLMIAVQEMSDRTATATGDSLGGIVRKCFPRGGRVTVGILLVFLAVANIVNLSADLMAVGSGMELLGAGPAHLWSGIAGLVIVLLLILGSYRVVAHVFTALCLALFAYVAVMFTAGVDWGKVWEGLTFQQLSPGLSYWGLVAGVFGTSISPYLFFWESGQRVEEMRDAEDRGKEPGMGDRDIPLHHAQRRRRQQRIDVTVGMTLAVLIMFSVVVATGATLGAHGQSIQSGGRREGACAHCRAPCGSRLRLGIHRHRAAGRPGAGLIGLHGDERAAGQGLGVRPQSAQGARLLQPPARGHDRWSRDGRSSRQPHQSAGAQRHDQCHGRGTLPHRRAPHCAQPPHHGR
jgi:hypothetical protein